jgi:transposase
MIHYTEANQWAAAQFLKCKNKTLIGIHWQLLAVYAEDTVAISTVLQWVRKSRDSGRNLDLNNELYSGRPAATTQDLNK